MNPKEYEFDPFTFIFIILFDDSSTDFATKPPSSREQSQSPVEFRFPLMIVL